MGVVLQKHTLDKRHHYAAVDPYVGAIPRTASLSKEVFQAPLKQDSMGFVDIVTTQQTVSWWSPQAVALNAPSMDLQLLRDCEADMGVMQFSWLGGTSCSC